MSVMRGAAATVSIKAYNLAWWGKTVMLLLAVAALTIQAVAIIDDLSQRSIGPSAGIAHMQPSLVIDKTTAVAEQMGIEVGDRVLKLNGQTVPSYLGYRRTLNRFALGSTILLVVERDGLEVEIGPVEVGRLDFEVGVFAIRHLVGLVCTAIATWVGLVRPGLRAAQLFFLAALGLGAYLVCTGTRNETLIYIQAAALAFTPMLAIHFFLIFPEEWITAGKKGRPLLYVLSLIFLGLLASAYHQSADAGLGVHAAPAYWGLHNQVGYSSLVFSGAFGLLSLTRAYLTTKSALERRRLQWIIWGLGMASLVAVIDLLLTVVGKHAPIQDTLLLLGVLPLPLAFAFSILRYRLWDIDFVLNRSVVYGLLTAVLAAVYLLLINILSSVIGITTYDAASAAVLFFSALVIGILVNPLRARIQSVIDRFFFRSAVDHQTLLAAWSAELSTSLRFADLAVLLLVEVPHKLQLERAWLLVLSDDESMLQPMIGGDAAVDGEVVAALAISAHSALAVELGRRGSIVLLYDRQEVAARHRDALSQWRAHGVRVVLPLVSGGRLVGVYLLGNKLSGDMYQQADLELLRTLANQSAVAISNARLYEEVHAFSQEMETKVRERTKELRDLVSVVYHELSTPITSVRGYAEVLLDGAPGPLTDRQVRYLEVIGRSAHRLMRLVGDLSDVSKIDDDRLSIHPVPMDLEEAVAETLTALSALIEEKGLHVSARLAKDAVQVMGDPQRIVQILTNLVGNACRYTPVGGHVEVCADRVDGSVEVRVSDTGIGIQKEDLDSIFKRFYRSQDPLVQSQPGTGLGLAITRSLVDLHGSKLWVSSTVGQGSTFGFALRVVEAVDE